MSCHPSRRTKEQMIHCEYALALRQTNKSDIMDQYLIGSIEPQRIAVLIQHNNDFHGGNTCGQLKHFGKILSDREKNPFVSEVYDEVLLRQLVQEELHKLQGNAVVPDASTSGMASDSASPAQHTAQEPSASLSPDPPVAAANHVEAYEVRQTTPHVEDTPVARSPYHPRVAENSTSMV